MNILKKGFVGVLVAFGLPVSAHAMCPICTFAIIGSVGLLEKYGVDDTVSGIWIGAAIISMTLWTIDILRKKNWKFMYYRTLTFLTYAVLTLVPLYNKGYLFSVRPHFLGCDRLALGIVVGAIAFYISVISYKLRKLKTGHALFPFQKVVEPLLVLTVISGIFYFITR
ncbi:MAG: hypothetical protein RLZZ67_279 [Candidatus Parcubacteria bacterium]|jgi:hypothetical protein